MMTGYAGENRQGRQAQKGLYNLLASLASWRSLSLPLTCRGNGRCAHGAPPSGKHVLNESCDDCVMPFTRLAAEASCA
jgi:hypothetical protein